MAQESDVPVIDLSEYFATGNADSLNKIADQLREACEHTGFFSIIGHQVSVTQIADIFRMARQFHQLDDAIKRSLLMDRADWPVKGVGYLPVKNRKLPARDRGNLNEAFIIKSDQEVSLEDNQWQLGVPRQ